MNGYPGSDPGRAIGVTSVGPLKGLTSPRPRPLPNPLFLHCAVFLPGNRVLSDETFRVTAIEGNEGVSEPYEFQLTLHGNTRAAPAAPLRFEAIMGRPVTLGIQYRTFNAPNAESGAAGAAGDLYAFQRVIEGDAAGPDLSVFSGIVSSFSMSEPGVYRLSVRPALWKLTITNRYEVYSQQTICAVIRTLLQRHQMSEDDFSLDAVGGMASSRTQDWMQAGETDYEFLSRLMSKCHIYYYFVQSGRNHKVVFANRAAYRPVFASDQPLRYSYTSTDELGSAQRDVISQYSYQESLTSSGVRGIFTRQHAAWEENTVAAFETYQTPVQRYPGDLPFNQYKIFQYGAGPDEVDEFARTTAAVLQTSASRLSGSSYCAQFRVGHTFRMTGADSYGGEPSPIRPTLEGRRFVLNKVTHRADLDGHYSNEFEAVESSGVITPFSMAETQQGAVVAEVVAGPGGTDPSNWRYYQNQENFSWGTQQFTDTEAVAGEQTLAAKGVFVQFSTDAPGAPPTWVKLSASMVTVPEIGVSVLVARAQDESELPEIQSVVQANGALDIVPDDINALTWTASTRIGSSYSTQYSDGLSIRYGARSQAQLTSAINLVESKYNAQPQRFRDTSYSQGGSYSFSCSEADADTGSNEEEMLGPYYAGASDLLSASESFGSTYNRRYGSVSSDFSNIGISYSNSTVGTTISTSVISGNSTSTSTINGTSTSTSAIGTSISTNTVTGDSTSTNVNIGNVTTTSTVNGISNNSSTTGPSTASNTVNGDSVTTSVNNGDVTSTSTITGTSNNSSTISTSISNNTVTGDSTSTTRIDGVNRSTTTMNTSRETSVMKSQSSSSAIGARNSNSAVGVSNSNDAIGLNNTNNVVGVTLSLSATGVATDVSAIGVSNRVSVVGMLNTLDIVGGGFKGEMGPGQKKLDLSGVVISIPDLQITL